MALPLGGAHPWRRRERRRPPRVTDEMERSALAAYLAETGEVETERTRRGVRAALEAAMRELVLRRRAE